MAVANDVYTLAVHALRGDRQKVENICKIIAAKEKDSSSLKSRMNNLMRQHARQFTLDADELPADIRGSVVKVEPKLAKEQVIIEDAVLEQLNQFLCEQKCADDLMSYGLVASNRILLSGPPGNGKTTLAGAIAKELDLPLLVIDFSSVIDSHLGSTGAKLAKAFRGASNIPCVLLLDEMETLLAERNGQKQEVGEISRIVSTLLLEIDRLSNQVILVGATNHFCMLDSAVARRFNHHWVLGKPSEETKLKWLESFKHRFPLIPLHEVNVNMDASSLSELENNVMISCKQWAMSKIESSRM